jgi:hypothetical protein
MDYPFTAWWTKVLTRETRALPEELLSGNFVFSNLGIKFFHVPRYPRIALSSDIEITTVIFVNAALRLKTWPFTADPVSLAHEEL